MKKTASIILCLLVFFALFGCTKEQPEPKTEEVILPKVTSRVYEEEFKNADGEVCGKISLTLPQIEGLDEERVMSFSSHYEEILQHSIAFGKDNAEQNLAAEGEIWAESTSYEVTYLDNEYISVLLTRSFAFGDDNTTTQLDAATFSLVSGRQCILGDFSSLRSDTFAVSLCTKLNAKILETYESDRSKGYIDSRIPFNEIINKYNFSDFYLTADGVCCFFQQNTIALPFAGPRFYELTGVEASSVFDLLPGSRQPSSAAQ